MKDKTKIYLLLIAFVIEITAIVLPKDQIYLSINEMITYFFLLLIMNTGNYFLFKELETKEVNND